MGYEKEVKDLIVSLKDIRMSPIGLPWTWW